MCKENYLVAILLNTGQWLHVFPYILRIKSKILIFLSFSTESISAVLATLLHTLHLGLAYNPYYISDWIACVWRKRKWACNWKVTNLRHGNSWGKVETYLNCSMKRNYRSDSDLVIAVENPKNDLNCHHQSEMEKVGHFVQIGCIFLCFQPCSTHPTDCTWSTWNRVNSYIFESLVLCQAWPTRSCRAICSSLTGFKRLSCLYDTCLCCCFCICMCMRVHKRVDTS